MDTHTKAVLVIAACTIGIALLVRLAYWMGH